VSGNKTTSALPKGSGTWVTDCQVARLVEDINCQSTKLLGHENCREAGGMREIESVGDAASAMLAAANTHNKGKKRFTVRAVGFDNFHTYVYLIQLVN
jgi:hypothetical protein